MQYEKQISTESLIFLPNSVSNLLQAMVEFKLDFDEKAKAVDGDEPPEATQKDAKADVYPSLPAHTGEELFYADNNRDPEEYRNCNKSYPEAGGITGGLSHVTCMHGITKGKPIFLWGTNPCPGG